MHASKYLPLKADSRKPDLGLIPANMASDEIPVV